MGPVIGLLLFVLPLFFRVLRPISPLLILATSGGISSIWRRLKGSTTLQILVGLFLFLFSRFLIQLYNSPIPSAELALRQLSCYAILCASSVGLTGYMNRPAAVFNIYSAALSAFAYIFLIYVSPSLPDSLQFRANFEGITVYWFMCLIYFAADRYMYTTAFLLVFLFFAIATHSGQGALAAIICLAIVYIPRRALYGAIFLLAAMPIALPLCLPAIFDQVAFLDSNSGFRFEIWSALLRYISESNQLGGFGFGYPLYEVILSSAGRPFIYFTDLDNVGVHNAILELGAYAGVFGLAAGILLLVGLGAATARAVDDRRVVVAFAVLMISFTFNMAVSALGVASGTAILVAVIAQSELGLALRRRVSGGDATAGAGAVVAQGGVSGA